MTVVHIIQIPDWHPARVNQLLTVHWAKASELKKRDSNMIWAYSRTTPKATTKRSVSLTIIVSGRGRKPDPDAFTKSLNDALVHNKLLVDDSAKWVVNQPVQIVSGKKKATWITLEDL